jgi:hypothetical protein
MDSQTFKAICVQVAHEKDPLIIELYKLRMQMLLVERIPIQLSGKRRSSTELFLRSPALCIPQTLIIHFLEPVNCLSIEPLCGCNSPVDVGVTDPTLILT